MGRCMESTCHGRSAYLKGMATLYRLQHEYWSPPCGVCCFIFGMHAEKLPLCLLLHVLFRSKFYNRPAARLNLCREKLTGQLDSAFLVSLEELQLQWLDLSYNQLSGLIPKELAALTSLQQLYLHNNRLQGIISENLIFLKGFQNLSLDFPSFQMFYKFSQMLPWSFWSNAHLGLKTLGVRSILYPIS